MYEDNQEEFLGPTLEDLENNKPPEPTNNYTVLKSLASGATGVPIESESFEFDSMVNESYATVARVNNAMDAMLMRQNAEAGNVGGAKIAYDQIQARLQSLESEQINRQTRLKEIAQTFIDNVVTSDPAIIYNNSPEKLAAQQNSAPTASILAQLERAQLDVVANTQGWVNTVVGIAQEILPTAVLSGIELDAFARRYLPEESIKTMELQSRTIEKLQDLYRSFSPEEKLAFIQDMQEYLTNSLGTSKWLASMRVAEVIGGERPDSMDEAFDILQKLGVPASLINVFGVFRGLSRAGKGIKMVAQERELAKLGMKDAIVKGAGARMAMKGVAEAVGQGTGISDVIDAAKLVAHTSAKILPEAITTASADLQKVLSKEVEKLREDIYTTVKAGNVRPEEAAAQLAELSRRYDPSMNKEVHTFNVDNSGKGTIVFQAPDGKSFLRREDAEAALKRLDPAGTLGMRIIPDTTNVGFLVDAKVVDSKIAERAQLEAELLKTVAEVAKTEDVATTATKVADKATPTEQPKKSKASKKKPAVVKPVDLDEEVNALFQTRQDIKPPNLATADDVVLFKASGQAVWSADQDAVRQWAKSQFEMGEDGKLVGPKVRAIAVPAQKAAEFTTPSKQAAGLTTAETSSKETPFYQMPLDLAKRILEGDPAYQGFYSVGKNVRVSESINKIPAITNMIAKLGKKLGMEDVPLLVMQWQDLYKSGNKDLVAFAENVAKSWPYSNATYTRIIGPDGVHIIMMRQQNPKWSMFHQVETFAHEYGHFFEDVWAEKYGTTIKTAFKDWVRSKKGPTASVKDDFSFAEMLQYRGITVADDALQILANKYDGDPTAFMANNKKMQSWLKDYSEFFAENFAKWALTDEVPVSILGQAFRTISNGIKALAEEVWEAAYTILGKPLEIGADKYVSNFLNAHIKRIEEGLILPAPPNAAMHRTTLGLAHSASDSVTRVERLRSRIEQLDAEIAAHRAATTGLTHGWLIERNITNTLNYADLGRYSNEDVNSLIRWSLGDWALGTSSELYANRVVGIAQSSRYQKLLTEFIQKDLDTLNKFDKQKLSDILTRGDKEGAVFDSASIYGMGGNKKVEQAYYKVRLLRDEMYNMRNAAAVDSLSRKGYKHLFNDKLTDPDNTFTFGRRVGVDAVRGKRIYNVEEGKSVIVTDDVAKALESGTLDVYEMKDVMTFGGHKHRLVMVDRANTNVSDIRTAIPYRNGEYKRIYSDEYFVKVEGIEDVDGVATPYKYAHRTAASRRDAEAYAKAMTDMQQLYRSGSLTVEAAARMQQYGWKPEDLVTRFMSGEFDDARFVVNYTRTDDDYIEESIATTRNYSHRRGERIPSVFGEDTVNTVNPLDSIAAEITNTAYMVPITEWRDVAVHRWYNTVRESLPRYVQDMPAEKAFYHMVNNKGDYIGNEQMKLFAKRVQDYVLHEMSIVTKEEQKYMGAIRRITEALENKLPKNGAIAHTGAALRSADPITFTRTVAFHSMLGGLNPVQLLVQAMNAFNAFTISPKYGAMAGRVAPLLRVALMSDNVDVWKHISKMDKLTSLGLSDADEFVETVNAIRRSGLLDGINSTSLYGAETGKYSLFNKWTRRAGATSAWAFNRGEEMSRIISFDIARREWKAANPGQAWWTDAALNKIMERQDDLTQNMTRANTAAWQRGVLSIPMQFMQYNVKIALNVIASVTGNKRAFSQREAAQLLVGHSLMFGIAGMGIGNILKEVAGDAMQDLTPEQALYVQQGIMAGVINSASLAMGGEGVALAIGSRFNTFETFENIADSVFVSSDDPDAPTVRDVLTGAVGATIKRFVGNFGDAVDLFYYNEDIDMATVSEAFKLIGTGTFSSLNNIHKSYLASQAMNYVQSKSGRNMFAVNDVERMLLGVGIPPASMADFELLMKDKKARDNLYKDVSKEIQRHQTLALTALNSGDRAAYESHQKVVQGLYAGLNVHDRIKVDGLIAKDWVGSRQRELLIERLMKDAETTPPLINRSAGEVR